jgi:hypothetical protein
MLFLSLFGGIVVANAAGSNSWDDVLFGDASGDGKVDLVDVQMMLKHVVGLITLDAEQTIAADVNGSGAVDLVDAQLTLQHIVGLITLEKPYLCAVISPERALTAADTARFAAATAQLVGVNYEPLNVFTVEVSSLNYWVYHRTYDKFYAKATNVTPDAEVRYVYLIIEGEPAAVTEIEDAAAPELPVVGGYTQERDLTAEEAELFAVATAALTGVSYEPLQVATQVVAGTNYKFYCKATNVVPDAEERYVYVTIFVSLVEGEPAKITEIVEVVPSTPPLPGGYTQERDLTAEDTALFAAATTELIGVNYEPLKVATQVVAGTNYKFYCKATNVVPDAEERYVYVTIFVSLVEGEAATVTSIVDITE